MLLFYLSQHIPILEVSQLVANIPFLWLVVSFFYSPHDIGLFAFFLYHSPHDIGLQENHAPHLHIPTNRKLRKILNLKYL